jgi:hypothetical protein
MKRRSKFVDGISMTPWSPPREPTSELGGEKAVEPLDKT